MLRVTQVIILLILGFCCYATNCATFEDVNGVLTKQVVQHWIGEPPEGGIPEIVVPTKKFHIKSDDSLAPYVNDEETLTIVLLDNQKIPKLPKDSIKDLDKITQLAISSSGLKDIEPGAFDNLPKLEHINLDGNELEVIKNGIFTGLGIGSLSLDNNKIATIEDQALSNLKNLKSLHLEHNKLSTWNGEWVKGSPIENIFLGNNLIDNIQPNSFNFVKSREGRSQLFFLQNNKIKDILPGAFDGAELINTLNLDGNLIEELVPGTFNGVNELNRLTMNNNKLKKIDYEVMKDMNLTKVILTNNQLSEFPLQLLKNRNVNQVDLLNNPITCAYVEEAENWFENKTGDYDRPIYRPAFELNFDEIKTNCVK